MWRRRQGSTPASQVIFASHWSILIILATHLSIFSLSIFSVDMQFKRQLSYYVFTIYIPTFMTVCVSWMSFWLDHKSAPARVALTITTLLAMSTTTSSINSSLPPVAYTKVMHECTNVSISSIIVFHQAIDVWNNICVSFVFLALLEYALVNYAARADAR